MSSQARQTVYADRLTRALGFSSLAPVHSYREETEYFFPDCAQTGLICALLAQGLERDQQVVSWLAHSLVLADPAGNTDVPMRYRRLWAKVRLALPPVQFEPVLGLAAREAFVRHAVAAESCLPSQALLSAIATQIAAEARQSIAASAA